MLINRPIVIISTIKIICIVLFTFSLYANIFLMSAIDCVSAPLYPLGIIHYIISLVQSKHYNLIVSLFVFPNVDNAQNKSHNSSNIFPIINYSPFEIIKLLNFVY